MSPYKIKKKKKKKTTADDAGNAGAGTSRAPADGFEAQEDASGAPAVVRRGRRARRCEARARHRGRARRAHARGRSRSTPGSPRLEPTRVLATPSGWNAAGRRVDRRSPRGVVGTAAWKGASARDARSTERPSRARATRENADRLAKALVSLTAFDGRVVPWAVSCHRSAWRIVRCLFGGEARQVTIVASRGSRRLLSSRMNVVCDDVVNSACTEVRRAGGSALERRGTGVSDTDLERDCSIGAFAQFPEPSISACFVSIRVASGSELLARRCVRF